MNELEKLTQETIYNEYSKSQPKLVELIQKLLDKGETPLKITAYAKKKLGDGFTTSCVYNVAAYLKNKTKKKKK
jgi:hypothetical protein